jgi:ATP adenylyltransferase/5',5'''-P-1,P-4-tetraphosphate phosphorylase II
MSYTQHTATAVCEITNVLDTADLISRIHDYLTNHEDEAPTELLNCECYEHFADILEMFVVVENNVLTISADTEENNSDIEVFDFLLDHCCHLMSSKFMKVTWISYDSRGGLSADCTYYDNQGNLINIERMLSA